MKDLNSLKSLKNKVVILRTDYNVPIKGDKVVDLLRIEASYPTINLLLKKNASIIILSHNGKDGAQSLMPVYKILSKKYDVLFSEDLPDKKPKLKPKQILLVDNIRKYKEEKEGSATFAKKIAALGDIYVNEAFPVSHRKHTSVYHLPKIMKSYPGIQLKKEIDHLGVLTNKAKSPFFVIIGGAKFSTKLPLIKKFLKIADYVFVGGALSNDLLKEAGFSVGKSLVEPGYDLKPLLKSTRLLLPSDLIVKRGSKILNVDIADIGKNDVIIDAGIDTTKALSMIVADSKTVLWNGPLGKYEEKGGKKATMKVLNALASNRKCFSVIGGGDITAVSTKSIEEKLTFVSTGGGAALEFLSKGSLPGIDVLK
ncbi:phosphoglycerate kinase [Candidatus Nomurabacteria bacterium]|nr:phosphoglycerate kinase [Candidatus Nomurabacteria bacterium]MCB9820372.1 phosphoglycerate kinase [Candidatus Nomurabacteria bacterium]